MNSLYTILYKLYSHGKYQHLQSELEFSLNRIDMGGHQIAYFDSGYSDRTILFIHGYFDAAYGFRKVVPFLDKRYRLILVDVPGFGLSEMPNVKYLYQVDIFAQLLHKFIIRMNLHKLIIVGHSMGGLIAQHLCLIDKIRGTNLVEKLILLASAGSPHPNRDRIRQMFFPSSIDEIKELLKNLYYNQIPDPNPFVMQILKHEWNREPYQYLAENTIEREKEVFIDSRATDINIQSLVISGENDIIITPAMSKRLHTYLLKSKLCILPEVGHALHLEKGELVANTINQWLMS